MCPKDVKKMLLELRRSTYRKQWAAKHEYEELKEFVRLEPALALFEGEQRRSESTDKHRNVERNLVRLKSLRL